MDSAEAALIKTGILTVSDRCSQGITIDESGENLSKLINSQKLFSAVVTARDCIPDDCDEIQEKLKKWETELKLHLILTIGGTGFTSRDITPEATRKVIDRFAPAITTAMTISSLQKTPMAMLSRAVCGIRGQTLIVNLPGSKKASQECLEAIAPVLTHAVDQLQGSLHRVDHLHSKMKSTCNCTSQPDAETGNAAKESKDTGLHDLSRIARRPRSSPYPMISVSEAQDICLRECPQMPVQSVSFQESFAHTVAQTVVAKSSLPPFPASIKDGYAVIASDRKGPRTVIGASNAGPNARDLHVTSGKCARISTGAPIPPGADAVVQVEDTQLLVEANDGEHEVEINILIFPKIGQDIRRVGSDIQEGEVLIREFTTVGSTDLGVMASAGVETVDVYKLPVTTVLSTGAEVTEPGKPLQFGCIWDSNRISLLTMLKEFGFPAIDGGIVNDVEESVKLKFDDAFSKSDVVVSTGGVSMGEKDILKTVLQKHFQATIHFARVFMKPGKPTTFATCLYNGKKKLVFALPGNPVSSVVTFYLYVLPSLRKMGGQADVHPNIVNAKLLHDIQLDPRPEYHRATVSWLPEDHVPIARSTGNQISSRLASMNSANALLVLPPSTEGATNLKRGEIVRAMIISRF